MSPGSCDRCARDVAEGELVNECRQCNWWMCSTCASKDCRAPSKAGLAPASPSLSAKLEEPKNPNVPFRGWMRHQFKVSDVRGRLQQEVREKVAAALASCADEEPTSKRLEAPVAVEERVEEARQEQETVTVEERVEEACQEQETDVRPSGGIFGGASSSTAGGPDAPPTGWPSSSASQSFAQVDTNRDGVISRGEWDQAFLPQQSQHWLVSNHWLQSPAPGLGYRCSPDLGDKHPDKLMARWGQNVCGVDMGNNFVRTTTGTIGYLPKVFNGQQVLVLADGPAGAKA